MSVENRQTNPANPPQERFLANPPPSALAAPSLATPGPLFGGRRYFQFCRNYSFMDDNRKWRLESGRAVEDVIFQYGQDLDRESAVHSFILDTSDIDVQGLFTPSEWKEILLENTYTTLEDGEEVLNVLEHLNEYTPNRIRQALFDFARRRYIEYSRDDHFTTDKMCYAIETLLHHYEKEPNLFICGKKEALSHIWIPFIDNFFGDIDNLKCVRNEVSNYNPNRRKRTREEAFGNETPGKKYDMVIKSCGKSGDPIEFGVGVVFPEYVDNTEENFMRESKLNLPKTLKEMFRRLCDYVRWDEPKTRQLEVIGYLYRGLVVEFLVLDHPRGYISRVTKTTKHKIPTALHELPRALELLSVSNLMKFRIRSCAELVFDFTFTCREAIQEALEGVPRYSRSLPQTITSPYY